MIDNEVLSLLLSELDGIANVPMTASQREMTAGLLLAESGVRVDDLTRALARRNLRWNQRKAEECGVSIETWQRAVRIVLQSPGGTTLRDLLERIHEAESAAQMLRAGYCAGRDAYGRLVWTR